jgi:hypothetical protein
MARWVSADVAAAPTILAPTFTISASSTINKPKFITNLSQANSKHPTVCPNGNIIMDHFLIATLVVCREGDLDVEVVIDK